jgi:hypothetical protein
MLRLVLTSVIVAIPLFGRWPRFINVLNTSPRFDEPDGHSLACFKLHPCARNDKASGYFADVMEIAFTSLLKHNIEVDHEATLMLSDERAIERRAGVRVNRVGIEMVCNVVRAH